MYLPDVRLTSIQLNSFNTSIHKYRGCSKAIWQSWRQIRAVNKTIWTDDESKLCPPLFLSGHLRAMSCKVKLIIIWKRLGCGTLFYSQIRLSCYHSIYQCAMNLLMEDNFVWKKEQYPHVHWLLQWVFCGKRGAEVLSWQYYSTQWKKKYTFNLQLDTRAKNLTCDMVNVFVYSGIGSIPDNGTESSHNLSDHSTPPNYGIPLYSPIKLLSNHSLYQHSMELTRWANFVCK